jgi:hypothetical protein
LPILSQKQGSDSGQKQRRDTHMQDADTGMVGDERRYVYAERPENSKLTGISVETCKN